MEFMSQLLVEPIKQKLATSQLLVSPEVKQLKPSQILRQTTMTQHFGSYGVGDKVCALGAIARHLGWDGGCEHVNALPSDLTRSAIPEEYMRNMIIVMNDEEHKDFYEIADWLESKGY